MPSRAPGQIGQTSRGRAAPYSQPFVPRLACRTKNVGAGVDAEQHVAELMAENLALRTEALRLRSVLDSATDYAIITLDLEGRIMGWNSGARAIVGYPDSEILGRSGEVLFPAEDRAEQVFLRQLCRALEEGRAPNERWHLRQDGSRFWASGSMMPLLGEDGHPDGFLNVFRDNSARRAEEERQALLLAEMGHRVKNTLASVQGVAAHTLRRAEVPEEVQTAFSGRLQALARSHDLLLRGGWEGAPLAEVAEQALTPYDGLAGRVQMSGPPVRLPADAAAELGLAFHELATNAAKHGALSAAEGRVELRWSLRRAENGAPLVVIDWREDGGPPVVPPARRGFGSELLEQGLAYAFGGTVNLSFEPEGVQCHICLPISPRTEGA
jgi:PAS domain S-box-containing protein